MNKNIFNAIFSTLVVIFITSCQPQPSHEVVYSQQGQPTTVVVRDNSGQEFLMNYLLWKSLMDRGGEIEVNNYYYNHRSDYEFSSSQQQKYRIEYNGYRSRKIQTQPSNGFGSRPVVTKPSGGFGVASAPSVTTTRNSGFGSTSKSTFTTPKPIQTTKNSGFGKKQ